MSAIEEKDEEKTSVDPKNLHNELARSFRTSVAYSLRQGLSTEEMIAIVNDVDQNGVVPHSWTPEGYALVQRPALIGKGVSDMRFK